MKTFRSLWPSIGLLLTMLSPAVQSQTKLLLNSYVPPTHVLNQRVFPAWIKNVEAATEGRVKVEIAPSSLAPPPGQLDLVAKGGADIAFQFSGVVPNRLHMNQMTQVPSPQGSAQVVSAAMWRTHQKFFGPANEYKGLKLLAVFSLTPNYVYTLKDPLTSLDQIKQMKILTVPGSDARAWGTLTTGVVTSPVVRFFDLVSKGTVDAFTSAPAFELMSLNLGRHTKYIVDIGNNRTVASFAFFMNEGRWNGLSPADRAAIEKVSGEAFSSLLKGVDDYADEVVKKFVSEGGQMVRAPEAVVAGIRNAYAPIEAEWVEEAKKRGVDGRAALDFFRAQVRELSK
jgi:TRAP-type C4-dicarboxylate transport system substrate-binding protein